MTTSSAGPEEKSQHATLAGRPGGQDTPLSRAREAAEALFKTGPAALQPEPRALAARSATPLSKPARDKAAAAMLQRKPRERRILPAEYARIRILATHGMTLEEVAELYGVGVPSIARIVGG